MSASRWGCWVARRPRPRGGRIAVCSVPPGRLLLPDRSLGSGQPRPVVHGSLTRRGTDLAIAPQRPRLAPGALDFGIKSGDEADGSDLILTGTSRGCVHAGSLAGGQLTGGVELTVVVCGIAPVFARCGTRVARPRRLRYRWSSCGTEPAYRRGGPSLLLPASCIAFVL
jgi:hypothetical protein